MLRIVNILNIRRIMYNILPKNLLIYFILFSFTFANAAQAGGLGAPILLTDQQLDSIVAGATVGVQLDASSTGAIATATTAGSARGTTAPILLIQVDPQAPMTAPARLLGTATAGLFFASGEAVATGTTSAQCSAETTAVGEFAFLQQVKAMDATPVSATCLCAAFGISLISR